MQFYSLFSKEAVVIAKIDQGLVIERKAAETISHRKALKIYVFSWKRLKYTFITAKYIDFKTIWLSALSWQVWHLQKSERPD